MGRKLSAADRHRAVQTRSRRRLVPIGVALLVPGLLVSGCSQADRDQIGRLAMPPKGSDIADIVDPIWIAAWIACAVVGFLVWGLILWVVFRYRRKDPAEVPVQTRYNLPIEVLYTVAPLIVVLAFFYWTEVSSKEIRDRPDPTVQVHVVGQKWAWTFNYIDDPGLDGQTDVYDVGTPSDFTQLYLPVGETVEFRLTSPDVIHSFWVPEFYFKLDVIPGRSNTFRLTPTREGTFRGRCAELCGVYHSRMLFDVHVVSREEYDQHLAELEAAGQVGSLTGQRYSETQAGLEEEVQE